MSENKLVVDEVNETVILGDRVINKEDITPSDYFDYVKDMKKTIKVEEHEIIIDTALTMLKKTKLTGQTDMAARLTHQVELALRELDAASKGFDIFVLRKDVEKFITNVESKAVKIIELAKYEREIPDEIVDKALEAKELFDEIYIIFTDYTKKETKKVAKARRDKDPIMFGAFLDKTADDKSIYIEDKLFFIADWKEDNCELTLEEIVKDIKDKDNRDITYRVSIPEDKEKAKIFLKSFEKPIEENKDIKPVSLFGKIKEKVKKRATRKKVKEE